MSKHGFMTRSPVSRTTTGCCPEGWRLEDAREGWCADAYSPIPACMSTRSWQCPSSHAYSRTTALPNLGLYRLISCGVQSFALCRIAEARSGYPTSAAQRPVTTYIITTPSPSGVLPIFLLPPPPPLYPPISHTHTFNHDFPQALHPSLR